MGQMQLVQLRRRRACGRRVSARQGLVEREQGGVLSPPNGGHGELQRPRRLAGTRRADKHVDRAAVEAAADEASSSHAAVDRALLEVDPVLLGDQAREDQQLAGLDCEIMPAALKIRAAHFAHTRRRCAAP